MNFIYHRILPVSSSLFFSILLATGTFLSSAYARILYPDMFVDDGPTDTFPSNFPEFNPPVYFNLSMDPDTPQIAEWTRQSAPGDTMILTGEQLSVHTGIAEGRDSCFVVYGEGITEPEDALIQRLDGQQCAITLPSSLPADVMYFLWPHNENGFGEPVAINKAESWWIGLDQLSSGDSFSVYGQNLVLGDDKSYLYIVDFGWIVSDACNPYKADFTLPDLTNGTYTCYAHNGHGRQYGWSIGRTFTVEDKLIWAADEWTDVTDYGATGDGVTDDAEAINEAYNMIKNKSEKTLYFPEGTYLMGSRLLINGSGSVRIKGAGMGLSIIKPFQLLHPYKMINVRSDHTCFEDITIETGGFGNDLNYQPLFNVEACSDIRFTRMQLVQTNATSKLENHFRALNADHLYFENCEFYTARSTWFERSEDIIIKECIWIGVHDSNNLLGMETARASVFDCTAKMLDISERSTGDGWAKGRWIAGGVRGWNNFYVGTSTTIDMVPRIPYWFYREEPERMSENIPYYTNLVDGSESLFRRTLTFDLLSRPNEEVNTLRVMIPNPVTDKNRGYDVVNYDQDSGDVVIEFFAWEEPYVADNLNVFHEIRDVVDQNSGEQIMFEGGNTSFRGAVSAGTVNSVTLSGYSENQENETYGYITVVDGRGLGQSRKIYSNSVDTIYIAEDWKVIPDTTSRIVVGRFCHRFVVYDNNLNSVQRPSYSASVGFQITGSGHSVVVDGNTISETRSAISLFAESQAYFNEVNIVNPIFFGLFQNNICFDNTHGISLIFGNRPDVADPYPEDTAFVGNVFRHNSVSNVTETGFLLRAETNDHVGLTVLANNEFLAVKDGVKETAHNSGLICLENRFDINNKNDEVGVGFTMSSENAPTLRNNTWSFFPPDSDYGGTLPGALLELPKRCVLLLASVANSSVEVRNGGTDSLAWEAETTSSWLRLLSSSGTVDHEGAFDTLSFGLEDGSEPEQGSLAVITVWGGGVTNQMTVVYENDSSGITYKLEGRFAGIVRAAVYEVQTETTFHINIPESTSELVIPANFLTSGYIYRWKLQEENEAGWVDVQDSKISFRYE